MSTETNESITFYDFQPKPQNIFNDVLNSLSTRPRSISPKYLYDQTGSRLFDRICELPEYYPTRTESDILASNIDEISECIGPGCTLVEPGSGNSSKVRILLDNLRPAAYVPIDISKHHLLDAAETVASDYPWLDVHATCSDYTESMEIPSHIESHRKVAFFPGSTIGNFEPDDALEFLASLASVVGVKGGLLVGVDLKKDKQILNAAYNDRANITAAFNLNLLSRINNELGANFNLGKFEHDAFYNSQEGRVEMHLVSCERQTVEIGGQAIEFDEKETIHTENSYKYSIQEFQQLAADAGFVAEKVWTDANRLFSVHYFSHA